MLKRLSATISFEGKARLLSLLIALLFSALFYLRAGAQDLRITFPSNSATLSRGYRQNVRSFKVLDSLLDIHGMVFVDSVLVVSKSSPEGKYKANVTLAEKRSQAMYDYVVSKYPNLKDRVLLRPKGEAWEEFRELVLIDSTLSSRTRERALNIIDSDAEPDAKKAELRKMQEYKHFLNDLFPAIRFSAIQVRFDEIAIGPPPVPELGELQLFPFPLPVPVDSIAVRTDTLVVEPMAVQFPLLAVSTNVVYDLGGIFFPMAWTPNVTVEVPIGRQFSIYAEYDFPWWVTKANNKAWQVLKWDLGARWWFTQRSEKPMDVLRGHFAGIDLGGGYYDIEPEHKGYQGEFLMVGAEYGYAFALAPCWRLDAYVGVGWLGTKFRYYEGTSDDVHLIYQHDGKLNWFGPVKAGVSIKYLFTHKVRKRRR